MRNEPNSFDLSSIVFRQDDEIESVLRGFNQSAGKTESKGFGIIVDSDDRCIGVVSEGDIRRAILRGINISEPISRAMNRDFISAKTGETRYQILRKLNQKIATIPVLDDDGKPVGLCQYSTFIINSTESFKTLRARVPLRISFAGGGTDLNHSIENNTAQILSSTIDKYCLVSLTITGDNTIQILNENLGLSETLTKEQLGQIDGGDPLKLVKAAIGAFNPDDGFRLEVSSEADIGTGLGGSSALVVAIIGVLNGLRKERPLDLYAIADLAYQIERIDAGIAGGWQDQYATTFGGFNWLEFAKDRVSVSPLRVDKKTIAELESSLLLCRIGGIRASDSFQRDRQSDYHRDPDKIAKINKSMAKLATKMKEALLKGETTRFGEYLHESWMIKKGLGVGVTSSIIDETYSLARGLGAIGGKLLGAGGSGYLLFFVSPSEQAIVRKEMVTNGLQIEPIRFCPDGLEVWSVNSH